MTNKIPSPGVVHEVAVDIKSALVAQTSTLEKWESLTPLARNEYLCWIEDAKKEATRAKRLGRLVDDLNAGKRRPCCWPGCKHRG